MVSLVDRFVDMVMTIPKNTLFPMCGMNLAFDRSLIGPAMYFGLMGDGQPIGRYDDMWAGWCCKVFMMTPSLVDLLILFIYCAQISSCDLHILKELLVFTIGLSLKEEISSLLRCLNVEFGTGDL